MGNKSGGTRQPIIGNKYHDWTVLADAGLGGKHGNSRMYLARCDNGHEAVLTNYSIVNRPCNKCRSSEKSISSAIRTIKGVQDELATLTESQRRDVEKLVARHVNACHNLGFEPENMTSTWLEAIEAVRLEPDYLETVDNRSNDDLRTVTRYRQYDPPKDVRI